VSGVRLGVSIWVCVVCVCTGCILAGWVRNRNALLYMFRMMFSSFLNSFVCRLYVFRLLCRNLIAAYLCCVGWLDVRGMIVSVYVGFL